MNAPTAAATGSESGTTLAPQRAMHVIAALARHPDGLSLAHLSGELKVAKSSLLGVLRSLEHAGYVESRNGRHMLGQEAYTLAAVIMKGRNFPDSLRAPLLRLHEACGETVMIGVPADHWSCLVYVEVLETDAWLRFKVAIGARRPFYCTAAGVALLAFAPAAAREHYLATAQMPALTARTVRNARELGTLLARVREQGYCVYGGSHDGVTGFAAPVFDAGGGLLAAVAIGALNDRVLDRHADVTAALLAAGSRMSRISGYTGPYPLKPAR